MKFDRTVTLGSILMALSILGGIFVFALKYEGRITFLEAANAANLEREGQFQRYVREALDDIKKDVRELRHK